MDFFAGIGSRETPLHIRVIMYRIAKRLVTTEMDVRSGGANGADTAFELGAGENKQIFLPWPGFNKRISGYKGPLDVPGAEKLAQQFHPAWDRLTRGGRSLQSRNCFQVLGPDLQSHSKFITCWTPGAKLQGGTAQAIRIAHKYDIPVNNLGDDTFLRHYCRSLDVSTQVTEADIQEYLRLVQAAGLAGDPRFK